MPVASFPHLESPLAVGRATMRNRILLAPMSVGYADAAGRATPAMAEHYGRRAQGGIGMVVTENVAVSLAGRQMPQQPMLAEADAVPGYAAAASEIHRHGALAVMQIVHAGRYAGPWDVWEQARRVAPSAVPFVLLPGRTVTPAEVTPGEIEDAVAAFANTAMLAERAGFDGVELHAAQGFLISSFLSPRMNRRTDAYGGDFAGRTRFLRQVLAAVRAAVSPELIVGLHLMSDELAEGGWTLAESIGLVRELEGAGLDFVMPVVSTFETMKAPENAGLMSRPLFQHAEVRTIKAATRLPVFTNGGICDPALIETILARGEADAVGLARPLFADPDWLPKARGSIEGPVRRCRCETALCLRTQLTGSLCESWPEPVRARGFLGYAACVGCRGGPREPAPAGQPAHNRSEERTMIDVSKVRPVNEPGQPPLTRAKVWKGLVMKANNALPFVPAMTKCEVVERRSETDFVREIEFRGETMREHIVLSPQTRVTFERLSGSVLGTILNEIEEDAAGALQLRFSFRLTLAGVAPGSAAEQDYARTMEADYLKAVDATLAAIRRVEQEESALLA